MKKYNAFIVMLATVAALDSCRKEEISSEGPTPISLQGTWSIVNSEVTVWEQGIGIVNPKHSADEFVGLQLVIDGSSITLNDGMGEAIYGPESFTLNEKDKTIQVGPSGSIGLGQFVIEGFVNRSTMSWIGRAPIDEDYLPQLSCSCKRYTQWFWTFKRESTGLPPGSQSKPRGPKNQIYFPS